MRRRPLLATGLLCAALCLQPLSADAAGLVLQNVDTNEYPQISVDVALTADLVPDSGDPGFIVLENGIEAAGVSAKTLAEERPPIDVVLLLDESGSMKGVPLESAKEAARSFVAAMRPDDRVAVLAFSSEPRVLSGFSSDVAALTAAINTLEASGETALYDGLIRAARIFEDNGRDRYITVVSDGGDTTSINTIDAASDAVNLAEAPVYAVALESPEYDPTVLGTIASSSGGRLVPAQDAGSLKGIFEDIARELRNIYAVTFTSARPSTKDLEIQIIAANGDVTGAVVTAVANPLHAESVLAPKRISTEASAPDMAVLGIIGMLVLVAAVLAVWALGTMLAPKKTALDQLDYYEQYPTDSAETAQSAVTARSSVGRVMGAVAYVSERRGFTGMVRAKLEQAGLPLRANEYIFFHVLMVTAIGVMVRVVSGSFAVTVIAIVFAVGVPIIWLEGRVSSRRRAFEEQLPDVLSLIAGSLRAGWGIQQAISLVVQEVPDPSSTEFRRVESETRFGLRFEDALGRMANRVDSEDFRWTVTAVSIQREVGGNLAEVLDIVASTIRERAELKRHVSALTAESRFSAIVLAVMPFFIVGALALVNPTYLALLFSSNAALFALAFGGVLLIIGIVWVIRLTRVEI